VPHHQTLAQHAANAVARQTRRSWHLDRPSRAAGRNIDAMIALAMAVDAAENPPAATSCSGGCDLRRRCMRCRALIDGGSYCAAHAPRAGSTRAWRQFRARVLARDGDTCAVCGAPAAEVDHVRAVRMGGTDDPANLRAVCRHHNPRGA
jgi:HNH endonuclease